MFLNFNKLTSKRKRPAIFALSFYALFSLLSSTALSVSSLEDALFTAVQQNNIGNVARLLNAGANPKTIDYFSTPPSIEVSQLLLNNKKHLNPNKFLYLVLDLLFEYYDSEEQPIETSSKQIEQLRALVNLALEKGANPNNQEIFSMLQEIDPKIAELLFNNNYKKINLNSYCQSIKKTQDLYEEVLPTTYNVFPDPAKILEAKYKNLNAKAEAYPKIPRILHHVWLTNEKTRREIPEKDIQHVLDTDAIFSQSGQKWEHIVWTNDKSLIPASVEKLEARGIKVKELTEIRDKLKLGKKIDELIGLGFWGMASDTLRIELVRCLGGIYSDLNYVFYRNLEEDIHKYDFLANSYLGYDDNVVTIQIFGAIPHHPILEEAVDLTIVRFDAQQKIVSDLGLQGDDITFVMTGYSLSVPYFKHANKNGTVDVLYPNTEDFSSDSSNATKNHQETFHIIKKYAGDTCNKEINQLEDMENFFSFIQKNEIRGDKHLAIGHDTNADSWVNPEANASLKK